LYLNGLRHLHVHGNTKYAQYFPGKIAQKLWK